MDWLNLLVSLLAGGAVGAIVTQYIAVRKLKPEIDKTDAETAEIIGKAWQGIVDQLRADLEHARSEIASLRAAQAEMAVQLEERDQQRDKDRRLIRSLQKQVAALRAQIADLGHEPYKFGEGDD